MILSVPVSLKNLIGDNFSVTLKYLRDCKAKRVFIVGLGHIYDPDALSETVLRQLRGAIDALK